MKGINYLFSSSDSDDDDGLRRALPSGRAARLRGRDAETVTSLNPLPIAEATVSSAGPRDTQTHSTEADHSRRRLASLFAQDSLQAQHARTTSLRYEEVARDNQVSRRVAAAVAQGSLSEPDPAWDGSGVSTNAMLTEGRAYAHGADGSESDTSLDMRRRHSTRGLTKPQPPTTSQAHATPSPSPLVTVTHALVQAYRSERYTGTCAAALCVPNLRHHPEGLHDGSGSGHGHSAAAAGHRASPTAEPLIAIVDATRRTVCRARLDSSLLLQLSRENPQYASLYVESTSSASPTGEGPSGEFWALMFRDRREAIAFVATAHTIAHYASAPASKDVVKSPSTPEHLPLLVPAEPTDATDAADDAVVSHGSRTLLGYRLWVLERVAKSQAYLTLGKTVDEVPAEAPREVRIGDGTLMDGVERGLLGMRTGEARLLFLAPGGRDTRVRRGAGCPEVTPEDTVVAYVHCVEAALSVTERLSTPTQRKRTKGLAETTDARGLPSDLSPVRRQQDMTRAGQGSSAAEPPVDRQNEDEATTNPSRGTTPPPPLPLPAAAATSLVPATGAEDTNALLQRALLQTLLANTAAPKAAAGPPPEAENGPGSGTVPRGLFSQADRELLSSTSASVGRVEHATDRMQTQLMSVSDKLDRLNLRRELEENNVVLEKMLRRVIGLAPQHDTTLLEDGHKDREALLATVERYKARYEEANANYQIALEGIGRYADKVHALEADVRIQKETLEARLADAEERSRLRVVEAAVKHRAELERVGAEKFRTGKEEGFQAGVKHGAAEALKNAGEPADRSEWKEKCFAYEREILKWKTELQEAQGRHIRERRALQAEVDSLQLLSQRLGARQEDFALRVPEETADQQCKRLKRALNAVYAQVEAQLAAHTSTPGSDVAAILAGEPVERPSSFEVAQVSVKDALSALIIAIKSEAKVFSREIKTEAALREQENQMLAQVRQERRERAGMAVPTVSVHEDPAGQQDFLLKEDRLPVLATEENALVKDPLPSPGTRGELPPAASEPCSAASAVEEDRGRSTQPFSKVTVLSSTSDTADAPQEAPRGRPLCDEGNGSALPEAAAEDGREPREEQSTAVEQVTEQAPPSSLPQHRVSGVSSASPSPLLERPEKTSTFSSGPHAPAPAAEEEASPAPTAPQPEEEASGAVRPLPYAAEGHTAEDALGAGEEETPMGRLAVRLDYGSAQTQQSYTTEHGSDGKDSPPPVTGPASSMPASGREALWGPRVDRPLPMLAGEDGDSEDRGRPSLAAGGRRADGGAPLWSRPIHDSPIPNAAGGEAWWNTTSSTNGAEAWDEGSRSPDAEQRGRDTSAPDALAGRQTVFMPPPPPPPGPVRRRELLEDDDEVTGHR